jgi:hypothetical protein
MSKQDRVLPRTADALERKFDFSSIGKGGGGDSTKLSQLEQTLSQFMVYMNGKMSDLENKLYPVGSFYVNVNDTDPTEIFGGTWEFYAEGHLLIGLEADDTEPNKMLQISDKCFVWKRIS